MPNKEQPPWDRKNLQALKTAMKAKMDQVKEESLAKLLETQAHKPESIFTVAYKVNNTTRELSAELRYNGRESI